MTKTYLVTGATWIAEVTLNNIEDLTINQIQLEACTQAVERHFGKRIDIPYQKLDTPLCLTEEQRKEDELHAAIVDLLTNELEPGCGIGMLLCVMDNRDPDGVSNDEDDEWYINSKSILENVGCPSLVKRFNEKYPKKKKRKS